MLLILDCTNLQRHLVLAAPILRLGLPTLVILNMADDLRSRGGDVDSAALSAELGAPVALISAAKNEGVDRVFNFLKGIAVGAHAPKPLMQLPVLQDVPRCRAWATQVGNKAAYQAPEPSSGHAGWTAYFFTRCGGQLYFSRSSWQCSKASSPEPNP